MGNKYNIDHIFIYISGGKLNSSLLLNNFNQSWTMPFYSKCDKIE